MKAIHWIIAAAAFSFVQPTPASAATTDPEVIIYRVSGVVDNNNVIATAFFCTNFSGVPETLRIVVRNGFATIVANVTVPVPHLNTVALSTHGIFDYDSIPLATGTFLKGTAAIAATSVSITCTAMQVTTTDPINPTGIALHMTRFNPVPGTQE